MSVTLIEKDKPKIKIPKIIVDVPLHKKLDKFEQSKLYNKSFSAGVLGKPGGGKTSMVHGMLETPELLKDVFVTIIYFMPPSSRSSISGSIFDKLNKEDIFDDLTLANLTKAEKKINDTRNQQEFSLIVFDDVQKDFKGEAKDLLLKLCANRRHLRLCMFFIAQSYKEIPSKVRKLFSDLYLFDLSADELECIRQELVPISRKNWQALIEKFIEHNNINSKKNDTSDNTRGHDYLYINLMVRAFFINFDKLELSDTALQLNNNNYDRRNTSNSTQTNGSQQSCTNEKKQTEGKCKSSETTENLCPSTRRRRNRGRKSSKKSSKKSKYQKDERPRYITKADSRKKAQDTLQRMLMD